MVHFEGVGDVVVGKPENNFNEPVCQAIQDQFVSGITGHNASPYESRSENAVVAFQEFSIVGHQIVGAVGSVGHHHRNRFTGDVIQTQTDGHTESMPASVGNEPYLGIAGGQPIAQLRGFIGTSVVGHDDFEGDVLRL